MLSSVEDLRVGEGTLEGAIDRTDNWLEMTKPNGERWRHLRLFFGDRQDGPAAWFFNATAEDSLPMEGDGISLRHYHRSDSFRIALGFEQPQQYHFRGKWFRYSDFRIDPANVYYADEWFGSRDYTVLILFGDRRGIVPVTQELAEAEDYADLMAGLQAFPWGDNVSEVFAKDTQAAKGLATTLRDAVPRAGLQGSFYEDGAWSSLNDGSRVTVSLLTGDQGGPAVLLSKNVPGVVESAAGAYGTDTLRIVLRGSVRIGDRAYRAGELVATEAGTFQGEVSHGAEGSWQMFVLADRRQWAPTTAGDDRVGLLPRLRETGALVEGLSRGVTAS